VHGWVQHGDDEVHGRVPDGEDVHAAERHDDQHALAAEAEHVRVDASCSDVRAESFVFLTLDAESIALPATLVRVAVGELVRAHDFTLGTERFGGISVDRVIAAPAGADVATDFSALGLSDERAVAAD